jgi:uncharacterized protein YjbI with pentapeptide repeats
VFTVGDVVAGTLLWRSHDQLRATVVVKATFSLADGKPMPMVAPRPLTVVDRHIDDDPTGSLAVPSDMAPFLAAADVVLIGSAYPPGGVPARLGTARLMIHAGREAVLDKSIYVFGDRRGWDQQPDPFSRVPLDYRRAFGGEAFADNPVGVGVHAGSGVPNLVDAKAPRAPGCFAPISREWPSRCALATADMPARFATRVLELPTTLDWAYFQCAPRDQRIGYLNGDEWISLQGVHPQHERIQSQLPRCCGEARIWSVDAPATDPGYPIAMNADLLLIDADAMIATLSWRGSIGLANEDVPATLQIGAAVAIGGESIVWRRPAVLRVAPLASSEGTPPPREEFEGTVAGAFFQQMSGDAAAPFPLAPAKGGAPPADLDAAAPFPLAPAKGSAPPQGLRSVAIPGAPWAQAPAPAVARPSGQQGTGTIDIDELRRALDQRSLVSRPATLPVPPTWQVRPPDPHAAADQAPPSRVPAEALMPPSQRFAPAPRSDAAAAAPDATGSGSTRKNGIIPQLNLTTLSLVNAGFRLPQRTVLAVIARATCDIVPGASALIRAECEVPAGDEFEADDPNASLTWANDFCAFKAKADVTVRGNACAVKGTATHLEAGFRFAGIERRVAVIGDRAWGAGEAPVPFSSMPLTWERAFGGAGSDVNPVGRGRTPARNADEAALERAQLRPNLEDPRAPVSSQREERAPMCFAPISPAWPVRMKKLGTFDAIWAKTRAPHLPGDFDPTFWQSAPVEQQIDFPRGDEPFELWFMHPEHPRLEGRLPGSSIRCFARYEDRAGGGFQEIRMQLDTVAFEPNELTLHLVWRGLVEVAEEEAYEIAQLFLISGPLEDEPMSLEEAHQRYMFASLAGEVADDALLGRAAAVADVPPAIAPPVRAGAQRVLSQLGAGLPLAGLNLIEAALAGIDLSRADLSGATLLRADLRGAVLAGANLTGAQLAGADLSDARLDDTNLTLCDLHEARVDRTSFARAELSSANLAGITGQDASFERATGKLLQLAEAKLDRARFDGAKLELADFSKSQLREASFVGAELKQARMFDAALPDARLDGAKLDSVIAIGSDLSGASLKGLDAAGSIWRDAKLERTTWADAKLADASFEGASCRDAIFLRADLRQARFRKASMQAAKLVEANLMEAALDQADLSNADLSRANLYGTVGFEVKLDNTRTTEAIVDRSIVFGGVPVPAVPPR